MKLKKKLKLITFLMKILNQKKVLKKNGKTPFLFEKYLL